MPGWGSCGGMGWLCRDGVPVAGWGGCAGMGWLCPDGVPVAGWGSRAEMGVLCPGGGRDLPGVAVICPGCPCCAPRGSAEPRAATVPAPRGPALSPGPARPGHAAGVWPCAGQAPPHRRRPSPRRGDVQWLGGPWRRAAGPGPGAPRCCCSCWQRRWEARRRRRSRDRRGSAGTSSAITTRAGRCTPGRRPGCPSPTTRCTSARPRVGAGRGRGWGRGGDVPAVRSLGAAERGGGGSATSGGARGLPGPSHPRPAVPAASGRPRRAGEREGRGGPAPSRAASPSWSPPPPQGCPARSAVPETANEFREALRGIHGNVLCSHCDLKQ